VAMFVFTRRGRYNPSSGSLTLGLGSDAMTRWVVGAAVAAMLWCSVATAQVPRTSRTVECTIRFDRNDLQKILEKLTDVYGVPFEIDGDDMRDAGITKCQSIGMDEKSLSVEEWLQKLLKRQNPDGRLAYTLRKDDQGKETVWIVTRKGAAKRGEELFPEFAIK
jgi:hypothetical protein